MRGLVWFLVVAALAVALGLAARMSEGYLLLVTPPYRTELSLALAVIVIVAAFVALYSILRLVSHTVRLPAYVEEFRRRQRSARGQAALRGGLEAYLEGRFGRAQQLAAQAFQLCESPGLAALIAARSAHAVREPERRDLWLERAETDDAVRAGRLATRAELLLDERRFEEAREALAELHASGPRHVATLRMMLRAEQGLQHWDEVLRIVRQLEKRGAIPAGVARQTVVTATSENLRRRANDLEQLREAWRAVPVEDRAEPRIAQIAARAFQQAGDAAAAREAIEAGLASEWSDELVTLYAQSDESDSLVRLERAESWLRERPSDAALHHTLGELCLRRGLWGKAESHLEQSLALQPSRAAHLALARLLDRLGRATEADRHYRGAADLA